MRLPLPMRVLACFCVLFGAGLSARAMEHVTLRNGFEVDCERREVVGDRVRLYLNPEAGAEKSKGMSYFEVAADAVVRVEAAPEMVVKAPALSAVHGGAAAASTSSTALTPTTEEMHQMLARAGAQHRVDEDLLASVIRAESAGRVAAVSRAGARGLMQLMPATAMAMGVKDAFVAEQNIDGGSAYLDWLLTRYHDDLALALAAYNAGPAAIDRWHGIPPYRETRVYVARVIREFNRRKLAER